MRSEFNKSELAKLNSILFNKKSTLQPPKNPQKEKEKDVLIEKQKQNIDTNSNNLHDQMQTLKKEVQTMLEINQTQAVEKVIRSTTRYYLEKIKNISVELPESLDSFKEAAGTFLESLPLRRRPLMKTERSLTISRRFGLKLLFKSLNVQVLSVYQHFMERCFSLSQRRKGNNIKSYENQRNMKTIWKYFNAWSMLLKKESIQYQHQQVLETVENTINLSETLLSQQKTIILLQKMLSREIECQILLVNNKTLYTYSQREISQQSALSQEDEQILLTRSDQPEEQPLTPTITKYQIQLRESLTKMCITKKQIVQTNTPNSDVDFSSTDFPVLISTVQSYPDLKQPLLFIPIIDNGSVIAVLRYFSYPSFPDRFKILAGTIQFVRATLSTSIQLNKIMLEYKEQQAENERQTYSKVINLIETIEKSEDISMRKCLSELTRIIGCQDLILVGLASGIPQLIYSKFDNIDTTKILTAVQKLDQNCDLLYIQSNTNVIGAAKIEKQKVNIQGLTDIFKLIFEKISFLKIKQLQQENFKKVMERQEEVQTRIRAQKIMRIGLSELASLNILNIAKVLQLLISEIGLKVADVFLQKGYSIISGIKYLRNQTADLKADELKLINQSNILTDRLKQAFGHVQINTETKNLQLYKSIIQIDNKSKLVICFGIQKNYHKIELIKSVLSSFTAWISHLARISDVKDTLILSKVIKDFKETLFAKRQNQRIDKNNQMSSLKLTEFNQQQKSHSDEEQINTRFTIQNKVEINEDVNKSDLVNKSMMVIEQFNKKCFNVEQHAQIQIEYEKNIAVYNFFSVSNEIIRTRMYNMFYSTKYNARNQIFVNLNQIHRNNLFTSFSLINYTAKLNSQIKRIKYENTDYLKIIMKTATLLFNSQNRIFFEKLKLQKQYQDKITKSVLVLQRSFDKKFQCFKNLAFQNIKIQSKPPNYSSISTLSALFSHKLSINFNMIKKTTYYQLLETDSSLISSLTFPQKFNLLKSILVKAKQLTKHELILENTSNSMLVCILQNNFIVSQLLPNRYYKVEFNGFNLVWKLQDNSMLSYELKQYLETISKIVSENIKIYQQLIYPIFAKLNHFINQTAKTKKICAIKKWRDSILHFNKLKQYHNIQKAYRLNNQIKLAIETKERKQNQINNLKQECNVLQEKLNASQNVLQYQRKQISFINKYLGVYGILNFLKQSQVVMKKRNCCWEKWKLMLFNVQPDQRKQRRQAERYKKHLLIRSGLKEISVIFKKKAKQIMNHSLKQMIVFCMNQAEQQSDSFSDPLLEYQQEQLTAQQKSFSIYNDKQPVHLRIPTLSSIMKQQSLISNPNQSKLIETRYYSVDISRKNTKSINKTLPLDTNQKQNVNLTENFFEPIHDIKNKVINSYINKSIEGSTFDAKNEAYGKYKLGEKTLKFLKRFGKGLNSSINHYQMNNSNSSLLEKSKTSSSVNSKNAKQ